MLVKPPRTVHIPGAPEQAYKPASTVCTPLVPPADRGGIGGGAVPPSTGGGSGEVAYYVYVPTAPGNPALGETRVPFASHPGAGYVCDVVPSTYFLEDPMFPNGVTPVYERRCHWIYP